MAENFYTILTSTGKAKLANSAVLGSKVNFKTLKVGDGKGSYYEPSENQTSLVNKVWSGNIGSISVDENNSNWIVIETLIPATIGGFFIREAGIFDEDDELIAISKLSETYKPVVSEGSIKDLCIKIILEVSNVESVTLKIDPTVIVATKKDILVIEAKVKEINAQLPSFATKKDINILESEIEEIRSEMSNDDQITQAVAYGMNSVIKNNSKVTVIPKFTIKGKTLVNLMGKDGNCEDISKFTAMGGTLLTLDNSNKVFGTNAIKQTISSGAWCSISKNISNIIDKTKYYCVSAYIKNGNLSSGALVTFNNGTNNVVITSAIKDSSKYIRAFIKLKPSDYGVSINEIRIGSASTTDLVSQYCYMDGVMLEEITSEQYNDVNFVPGPYVDSYTCLTNPYMEVRHNNLVRNGNGEEGISWWNQQGTPNPTIENDYFKFTDDDVNVNEGMYQYISVKPGNTYSGRAVIKAGTCNAKFTLLEVDDNGNHIQATRKDFITSNKIDTVATLTITISKNISKLGVFILCDGGIGTSYFKEVSLIESSTPPDLYKPCSIERVVIEGQFTEDDDITYENGKVSGELWWKHKTLFGKDYDWLPGGNFKEYKKIYISIPVPTYDGVYFSNHSNGTFLKKYNQSMGVDYGSNVIYTNGRNLEFGAPNSDTGWQESISSNSDEVKAYMNGWRSCNNSGTRYTAWNSIPKIGTDVCANNTNIDAFPPGSATTLSSATNGTTITVNNPNIFRVGDSIAVKPNAVTTVAAISGNTITLAASQILQPAGNVVFRLDNGITDTRILNYCVNNVAPGYEGYKVHYKLKNPEYITEDNVHIHGDIPKYGTGDNYVYLDSGYVLGEVVNPTYHNASDYQYKINSIYYDNKTESYLENKTECIFNILKNNLQDNNNWFIKSNDFAANGRAGAYIISANYDSNAEYSVDYKILSTIAPTIGTISCSYTEDIISAINDLYEDVNSRQTRDSILDEIVDLSVYEYIERYSNGMRCATNWFKIGGRMYLSLIIPVIPKKCIPTLTFDLCLFGSGTKEITSKIMYNSYTLVNGFLEMSFYTDDSDTVNTINSYGVYSAFKIKLDCRGRL